MCPFYLFVVCACVVDAELCVRVRVCAYVRMHVRGSCACAHACACVCVCVRKRKRVRVSVCACACACACMCVCMCVCVCSSVCVCVYPCRRRKQYLNTDSLCCNSAAFRTNYMRSCWSFLGCQPSVERATFASAIAVASCPSNLVLSGLVPI